MKRFVNRLGKINWGKSACVLVLWAVTAISLPAQTFTTLFRFSVKDGANPEAGLVQATNGDLYGTTFGGGATGGGTVFKIGTSGVLATLYSFCSQGGCADGGNPEAVLVQAADGDFYGTTLDGGTHIFGTVFKITPSGTLTTLYSFCSLGGYPNCRDGQYPHTALVEAANRDLYGTTSGGGANGGGTVFKITPSGTLTTLYHFCEQGGCADGKYPAGLVQAIDGDLYGTTFGGGANSEGTIFKITASGTLTTLYSFCPQSGCTDGGRPSAGLVEASNWDLYGTTSGGGANCAGTVFNITPCGTLTTLYSFCSQSGCTDGQHPEAGLVQAANGDFYGTASGGPLTPNGNYGTVFRVTPSGTLTTLHSFCSQSDCADGTYPKGRLLQATNGDLYGTTYGGGEGNYGTVFSLSVGP